MNTIATGIIVANIALSLVLIYLTSFIKKRGEINATQKDIEILTDKIEAVKLDYLKKIEEYKTDLTIKYELGKTLINSRAKAYQLCTLIKTLIIRSRNKPESAKELIEELQKNIPELLISLYSQVQLRSIFQEEIKEMENNYNNMVSLIRALLSTGATQFDSLTGKAVGEIIGKFEDITDRIQLKLIE